MRASSVKPAPAWPISRIPRFSVQIPQQDIPYAQILDIATEAERLGFDAAWLFDHFFPIVGSPEGPCLDGWTALSAVAARTRRIRLGILVSGNTYRHPSVLAKMGATVDVISGGRLEFGLGAGWFELEHRALGIPFPPARERLERLEEALRLTRRLWTEDKVDFDGRYYRLREALCNPKPIQRPHPPIMVGGGGERRTLRSVARHADLWNTFGPPESFRRKIEVLREHCLAEGRNPDDIEKSVLVVTHISEDPASVDAVVSRTAKRLGNPDPAAARAGMLIGSPGAVADRIREYHEAGVTHIILGLLPNWDLESFRRFARDILPLFRPA